MTREELSPADIESLGAELRLATDHANPVAPLRSRYPSLTVDDAYRIQRSQLDARRAGGARLTGRKIGLTSRAMQEQLGISSPDFGYVLDDMTFRDGDEVPIDRLIAPRVEPELAFVLGRPMRGPGLTREDVVDAVDHVFLALEIIDSRVQRWDIALVDTVADNASCGAVVLGRDPIEVSLADLAQISVELAVNGRVERSGTAAAVMGDPLAPLAWLANVLGEYDEEIRAGEFVLTGAFTAAAVVEGGDTARADFGPHGAVAVAFGRTERKK